MHVDRICFQAQFASVCDQRLDFIEENKGRTVLSVFSDRPTEQLSDSFLGFSQRGALQGMRLNFQVRQLLRFEQSCRLSDVLPVPGAPISRMTPCSGMTVRLTLGRSVKF